MRKDNYNVKPTVNSGVGLLEKETISVGIGNKKHPMLSALLNVLLSALLTFGAILSLSGMFAFNVNYIVLCAVLAVSVFVFSGIFYLPKKPKTIGILSVLGVVIIVCAILNQNFFDGCYNLFLFGREAIYNAMYWTKNYKVDLAALSSLNTTLATSVLGVFLSLGVTYFNKDRVRFGMLMLLTFPFFEIGAAFGCVPPYYAFAILLSGWTAAFAIFASSLVGRRKKDKKQRNTKQTKAVGIGAVVAVITLLAFLGCNTLLTLGGYTRDNGTKDLRLAIKEGFNNIYDLITGEDHDASMKDGKLYKLGDRNVKNRVHLTVTTSGFENGVNHYVKGYVGAKYTGNEFVAFDNYAKYEDMYNAFKSYNLYPQQMTGAALQSIVDAGEDGSGMLFQAKNSVTISNLRRKKTYAYTFDNTYFPTEFNYNYDLTARPPSSSKYSYTSYMSSTSYININLSPLYFTDEYQQLRGMYNEYVKKEYLQLPENNAYLKNMVKPLVANAYDDFGIADQIRKYLKENTVCTDYVGDLPAGRDFVNYFLMDNKKGYSAHYAATATLMLRAAGVPARYVEGFVLTYEDNIKHLESNAKGEYEIDLTDKEAHAWVEIYSKNYGWISVEVTPGFYSGNLNAPSNSDTNNEDYHIDVNSDITIVIPPTELPENEIEEIVDDKTLWQQFLEILPQILKIAGIVLLSILGVIAAALIILSTRLLIIRGIRNSRINKDDGNAIFVIYKYFNKLLLFEKIKNTEMMPYLRYMDYASSRSRALNKENAIFIMNIFLKAAFSPSGINEQELIACNLEVNNYKKALLKTLTLKEKILFIFINALV